MGGSNCCITFYTHEFLFLFPVGEQLWSPSQGFFSSVRVLLNKEYRPPKWWICHAPPCPRKVQGNHCFGSSCSWLSPQIPHLKTTFFLTCEEELSQLECVCVCVGVTQEEGNTGFSIHLLSAVLALIFLARRIQPSLSLVDREAEFCVRTI